jgi:hypothetical protein
VTPGPFPSSDERAELAAAGFMFASSSNGTLAWRDGEDTLHWSDALERLCAEQAEVKR